MLEVMQFTYFFAMTDFCCLVPWRYVKDAKIQVKKDFEIHAKKDFEIQAKKDAKAWTRKDFEIQAKKGFEIQAKKNAKIQAIHVFSYSFCGNSSRAENIQGWKLLKGGNY